MSYETEADTIRARFNTQWKTAQGFSDAQMLTRVAWPNKTFTPPSGLSWTRLQILPAGADQTELAPVGSRTFRHDGMVVGQVFTPANTGDETARNLADDFAAIFRGVTVSGITFLAPYVTEIGVDPQGWYGLNVWCPYYRDSRF